jgi:L-lysine 2,3-aminomutase
LHVNHPQELDEKVFQSIFKLQSLNIPFFSQSVLLKDVNDNVNTLLHLFEILSNHGIIPYYLHQLDKVIGAAHFEVALSKGKKIIHELKELTSGYNVPYYVREDPFEKSKTSLI